MFKNFINALKVKEIRNKILLTILLVLITLITTIGAFDK